MNGVRRYCDIENKRPGTFAFSLTSLTDETKTGLCMAKCNVAQGTYLQTHDPPFSRYYIFFTFPLTPMLKFQRFKISALLILLSRKKTVGAVVVGKC